MNTQRHTVQKTVAELPISSLAEGEICPPLDPDHASWDIIAPWDDPLGARGGYNVPSRKTRETHGGRPAIEWLASETGHQREDRMFVIGEHTWREYSLSCCVQPIQDSAGPTHDEPFNAHARAGLVFRMETVRRFYMFCIENRNRLVVYRRNDAEWVELAGCDIEPCDGDLTLRVSLDGDGIRAACDEKGVAFDVTDNRYRSGLAGFRALGACRLFSLAVAMSPGQEAVNQRLAESRSARTRRFSESLPDEIEVGTMDLGRGRKLVACEDFCVPGRNDLLFSTADGLIAETWDGTVLWQCKERLSPMVFSAEPVEGRRILFGLSGERQAGKGSGLSVAGVPHENIVQDELLCMDGGTGAVMRRVKLPTSPREDLLRHYDLSYETGRISGKTATDILVREWRQDWGGGGEMVWAYDSDLNPLWEHKVHPGYGHHNALHFFDVDRDGRDEILAGGNLLSPEGDLIWRHDQADAFFKTVGGQHYDAAMVDYFADDPECDPCAFLIGGSAGVYVVDALNGRTRSHHLVGHAQGGIPCRLRDDLPGKQVLVSTRWGNYGIATLFSGRGDRLWSIQPGFLPCHTTVTWLPAGPQFLWYHPSMRGMGLYDGRGRMVKPLDKIRKLYQSGTKKPTRVLRRTPDGTDLLGFQMGERLHLFGPDI